jgi:ribosomal protein S18 acetylase RimI-like enzyme
VSDDVAIVRVDSSRLDDLEGSYRALHGHHTEIVPRLTGVAARKQDESWARRRPRYESWLSEPGAFALLAESPSGPLGLALVTIADGYDSWQYGRIGELRDLAVLPSARGAGVGRLLLERVVAELAANGIEHYRLTVLAGNDDAIRFYERAGLETVMLTMQGPTGST